MARAYVSRRALLQIDEIDQHSISCWGDEVAASDLNDLFAAIQRLESSPDLLRRRRDFSVRLRFYRVRQHTLVCDVLNGDIFVLAVWQGAMDLPDRLERLEPQLVEEAELMARRIENRGGD